MVILQYIGWLIEVASSIPNVSRPRLEREAQSGVAGFGLKFDMRPIIWAEQLDIQYKPDIIISRPRRLLSIDLK